MRGGNVEYSGIVNGIFNKGISKRGMTPEQAIAEVVKVLKGKGLDKKQINTAIFSSLQDNPNFNRSMMGVISQTLKSLEKKPLSDEIRKQIEDMVKIFVLRDKQQRKYLKDDKYVDFNRIKLNAEDYSFTDKRNILDLIQRRYKFKFPPKFFQDYQQELEEIIERVYNENKDLSLEELEAWAIENDFLKNYIESPNPLSSKESTFSNQIPMRGGGGVVRFAPTPNGPMSLGHARGIAILAEYCDMYGLEFHLRFDDTDQGKKTSRLNSQTFGLPPGDPADGEEGAIYKMIIDDVSYILGRTPDKIVYSSDADNLKRYAKYAKELIENGLAFCVFVNDDGGKTKYTYGKTIKENLEMFRQIKDGRFDLFDDASVLLALNTGGERDKITKLLKKGDYEGARQELMRAIDKTMQKVTSGKDISTTIQNLNNNSASRLMRPQRQQNVRVEARGDNQYMWPLLGFQGVIDDWQDGTTHSIRGLDYNELLLRAELDVIKEKMKKSPSKKLEERKKEIDKNLGLIQLQEILRLLFKAPPINTLMNWGNVSWDGDIWDYDTTGEEPEFKDSKTNSISTSKVRAGILDNKYPGGFSNPTLPTVYSIRSNDSNPWGSSLKTYWTRFYNPIETQSIKTDNMTSKPLFIVDDFYDLDSQLKFNFPSEDNYKAYNQRVRDLIKFKDNNNKYGAEEKDYMPFKSRGQFFYLLDNEPDVFMDWVEEYGVPEEFKVGTTEHWLRKIRQMNPKRRSKRIIKLGAESFDAEVYAIEDGGKTELSFQELFDYLNGAIDNEYFLTKRERDDYYEKYYREYEAESFEAPNFINFPPINNNPEPIERVNHEQVEHWLGSDTPLDEAIDVLTDIANEEYQVATFRKDVLDISEELNSESFDAESFEAPKKKIFRGKRPSPSTSATSVNIGTKMRGGNGKLWVCKSYPRGKVRVKRWVLAAEDFDADFDKAPYDSWDEAWSDDIEFPPMNPQQKIGEENLFIRNLTVVGALAGAILIGKMLSKN